MVYQGIYIYSVRAAKKLASALCHYNDRREGFTARQTSCLRNDPTAQ